MRFVMDGLTVFFPFEYMYPEQYKYMRALKQALDAGFREGAKGHCLLEMPTGTGKTVCLLSLITSYQFAHPTTGKLVYCTRTVPEMRKVMAELKVVLAFREKELEAMAAAGGDAAAEAAGGSGAGTGRVLAVCLSSRKNLCINRSVMQNADDGVDGQCRSLTAPWVRAKASSTEGDDVETCSNFEGYFENGSDAVIPPGVYSLDDMKALGEAKGWCPYYMTRHAVSHANIVVFNYQYMLDPKVAGMVSKELEADSIVVFDEAHNIDSVCIEALTVEVDKRTLQRASRNLRTIQGKVDELKRKGSDVLQQEYSRLVAGLRDAGALPDAAAPPVAAGAPAAGAGAGAGAAAAAAGGFLVGHGGNVDSVEALANPVLPAQVLEDAIPGQIRRADHFVSFLKRLLDHMKRRLESRKLEQEAPTKFLHGLETEAYMDPKPMKFCYTRLASLLRTLEITGLDEFSPLTDVADFAALVATYDEGFQVLIEPTRPEAPNVHNPVMTLACLDSSLALKPVLDRFACCVITSGTLSPIDLYPKLLNFTPMVRESLKMSVLRPCICPLIVTRGSDQLPLSSRFEQREDMGTMRNYGSLLVDIAKTVPDGVVCFFTSYMWMEKIVSCWDHIGVLKRVLEHKLLFIETKDIVETTLALDNFKRACDSGKGAVFLSIARGKVAEGIDFDRHYGRAVMLFGIPFQFTKNNVLLARLEWLRAQKQVKEADYLTFDAMRNAAQCVGRVIRSKTDYGVMVFADSRYNMPDKRNKLPP